jgi:predicted Zn-dependent protease with MMP-like domain
VRGIVIRLSPSAFESQVKAALAALPRKFSEKLSNVAIIIKAEPTTEELASVGISKNRDPLEDLLGLYVGVPLVKRGVDYMALPDKIFLFRGPILRRCRTRREVAREVRQTLIHEIGHHFGMKERDLI